MAGWCHSGSVAARNILVQEGAGVVRMQQGRQVVLPFDGLWAEPKYVHHCLAGHEEMNVVNLFKHMAPWDHLP